MTVTAAVSVKGLNHFYGRNALKKQILFDIDVEISKGEIVITTGPSGSGKTTLLTLLGALRSAQDGSLNVLGHQLVGANKKELSAVRRKIGFIFQHHNLLAAVSALENVELGLRCTGRYSASEICQIASDMLDQVGLSDRKKHKPEQLSGGQRQRVAIARALAAKPQILLADEPTASLDKESGRAVVEIMRKLAKEQGTTILIVTHDNRILDVADRIIHLEDGHLSTFTDAVISNNKHMMEMLGLMHKNQDIRGLIDDMNQQQFKDLVTGMTEETVRFAAATSLANDQVHRQMLENALFAFTRKLTQITNADRASLFLIDHENESAILKVTDSLPVEDDIRVPINSGLVGAAVTNAEPILVEDAYQDSRFNPTVDKQYGYKTTSMMTLPITAGGSNEVYAVAQLLNRLDGKAFDQKNIESIDDLVKPMGEMLANLHANF